MLTRAVEFADHLLGKSHIPENVDARADTLAADGQSELRKLWERAELPANEFADEVAVFYQLPRVHLPQLLSASALVQSFSRRFLRETEAFPYRDERGGLHLAIADPTDTACVRAAEIVLGGPVAVEIASFEDIATALTEKIGGDDALLAGPDGEGSFGRIDDDIDSLRDLASGAPVVRAVNDLLEKALELRASDIHIEPFRPRWWFPLACRRAVARRVGSRSTGAGDSFTHQDTGGPRYRRTPSPAGWCGADACRAIRPRHSSCHHADPAR